MALENNPQMPALLRGDRPLPHNPEAEVAVLGAMMLDPDNALDIAAARLSADSFFTHAHQTLFDTFVQLANEKSRGAIDLITVMDALAKAGKLDEIGGRDYVMQIMNSVPTAANIEQYVEIVQQTAVLRRLIATSADVMERCYRPSENVRTLLDEVEQKILEVTNLSADKQVVAVGDCVIDAVDHLEQLRHNDRSAVGLSTGYPDLDKLITGLKPAEMFVLAARPSIGKTALALNITTNIALQDDGNHAVGFFSLEMSSNLLVLRLLCSLARLNLGDMRDGAVSTARWAEIMQAGERLKSAPVYIDDTGNIDVVELRAKARRMAREHKIELLVIDYLQLMQPVGGNRNTTRENDVARMSGGIKSLAKELNIPIIVLAQLNRQAEQQGQQPKLSHLRESGAIEQDADLVALLHRERDADGGGSTATAMDAELIVAKHRNGPTGVVQLFFRKRLAQFLDAETHHEPVNLG